MLLMKWLDTHLKQTGSFAVKIDDDVYFDVEAFIARTYKVRRDVGWKQQATSILWIY